jgi:hypothetical protein
MGSEAVLCPTYTPLDAHCPWSAITAAPAISPNTGSDEAVERVRSWLNDCLSNHSECTSRTSPVVPTRLVRIQGPADVRLHITNDTPAPYMCLSHCWGLKTMMKTTLATIGQHEAQIAWEELPRTFQDAISFAHRLGYAYIWIDSLCIIQDSVDDWRREGSRMANTYQNSDLTLAATRSADSSGGCFVRTNSTHHSRKWNCDLPGHGSIQLHSRTPLNHDNFWKHSLPLLTRGWVLQESILSPRTLHFSDNELVWECCKHLTCECSRIHASRPYYSKEKIALQLNGAPVHTLNYRWQLIVQLYSEMSLTYPNDIFPALQGLANSMPPLMGPYLAGLWGECLVSGLTWFPETVGLRHRPIEWRAPTWSWASTLTRVYWYDHLNPSSRNDATVHATCHATTQPKGKDVTGELISGELVIKGHGMQGTILHGESPHAAALVVTVDDNQVRLDEGDFPYYSLKWDYTIDAANLHQVANGTAALVIRVQHTSSALSGCSNTQSAWLVLVRSDKDNGTFERIGLLLLWGSSEASVVHDMECLHDRSPEVEVRVI